jgi:hypothetical protein
MLSGGSAARDTASWMAAVPSPTAVRALRAEPYFPTGVLTAEMMTDRIMESSAHPV